MKLSRWSSHALPFVLAIQGWWPSASASGTGLEDAYLEPLPIVLTAARLPQPLRESPVSITVLDEDLIRATGYRSIPRLLRLVPGMQVGQERGHNHWVTYHGLGIDYPNQMQVLIDGRSVHSPDGYSGADWTALPVAIEDIERIEVVRGSNSAAYGSNAFLGVVNILTRHPRAESGSTASVGLGPDGRFDLTGRYTNSSGPLGLRVTAQREHDRGSRGIRDDTSIDRANVRGDLRLGPEDELSVLAGLSDGTRGQGYPGTLFNVDGVRDARHHNRFLHAEWHRSPSSSEEFTLSYSINREHYREAWFGEGVLPVPAMPFLRIRANNDRDVRRDDLHLRHYFAATEALRLLWGAEWRRDRMDAPFLFHDRHAHTQDERRLYGNLEWRAAAQWVVNAGAMAEQIAHDGLRMAPRFALNWLAGDAHTWRAAYSRAYRYPSLFERYADVQVRDPRNGELLQQRHRPNPNIRPQRIDAFEIGYLGRFADARGMLDVRLFDERIRDLIRREELAPDPLRPIEQALGASRWENLAASVRLTGIEYQLRYHPWDDGEFILNHTLVDARSRDPAVARTVAPYVASLTWLQRLGAWQAAVSLLRMGPVDLGTGFIPGYRRVVPAYATLDASVARDTLIGGRRVTVRLSGINLLGPHQEVANRPLQQRAGDKPANEIDRQIHLGISIAL